MSDTCYTLLASSVGPLLLVGDAAALFEIRFASDGRSAEPRAGWVPSAAPFREAVRQLEAYFRGERRDFDLPLAPRGTPFQLSVWDELRKIPYGRTISYGDLARRIGKPSASRAVGAANGRNPLSIVVPCHRVIGSSGALTGFGGGLPIKQALLQLEGAWSAPDARQPALGL